MTTWNALSASPWRKKVDHWLGFETHKLAFHRRPPAAWQGDGQCWVGAAAVDITPPPGIPKGGYASWARTGNGFRTRLKARAFYLKDARGSAMLILQVDLHAGSALLREQVAQAVAAVTDIPQHAVCLTCTHTHSGPGQFIESNFYNDFTSNKPGFDPALFEWLGEHLLAAALQAWRDRRPGRIAVGKRDIIGFSRNRSWAPHRSNHNVEKPADDVQARFREVNPYLHMLRLDARNSNGDYQPLAALSSFSIHGTAVPRFETTYNADLWAYLERELEWEMRQQHALEWAPVHGACQGTHGDVAPAVETGKAGFPEARRVGMGLAREAITLFHSLQDNLRDDLTVGAGLRQVDCYQNPSVGDVQLASRPVVGNALVAGAYENFTPVLYHAPFFGPGLGSARFRYDGEEQGAKRQLAGPLQPLLLEKDQFPHQLLFQTLRIGNFWLLAVPFEVTTEAGRRMQRAVEQILPADAETCVTSLANGYTGYVTTTEEYAQQHYEGGHTLYGPNTNAFIAAHLQSLAQQVASTDSVFEGPECWRFELKSRRYFPQPLAVSVNRRQVQPPVWVQARNGEQESRWSFTWMDVDPASMDFNRSILSVETCIDGRWQPLLLNRRPVDDEGYDLAVMLLPRKFNNEWQYEGCWYWQDDVPAGRYRFRVAARADNQPDLLSSEFLVGEAAKAVS